MSSYRGRERQQPRCPRAPRAGYETTWRRLMRAWLGPKPGSLSVRRSIQRGNTRQLPANCGELRATKRQLRPYARIYARLHGAAPAERGGGCGGTRSRQQAGHTQNEPLTYPLMMSLHHKQGRTVEPCISAANSTALRLVTPASARQPAEGLGFLVGDLPGLRQELRFRRGHAAAERSVATSIGSCRPCGKSLRIRCQP